MNTPIGTLTAAIAEAQADIEKYTAAIAQIRALKQAEADRLHTYDGQIAQQQAAADARQVEITAYRAAISKLQN